MFVPMQVRATDTQRIAIAEFRGADLCSSPTGMSLSRSPSCPNMMRSVPNKVRKRMGYYLAATYSGRINGRFAYQGKELVHAGHCLYLNGVRLSDALQDTRSRGFYFNRRFFLLDGAGYYYVQNDTFGEVKNVAYVPVTTISRDPSGGGAALEDLNLIGDCWEEKFYGTETDREYQLSFGGLSAQPLRVVVRTSDGTGWTHLRENVDYTVDRTAGVVTFAQAPGKSPMEGVDNVTITAARDMAAQRQKIAQADVCVTYSESGSGARVFVTGCPSYPNRDYWCALNDPTYFPARNYSVLGQSNARIMGYSVVGAALAAHKSDADGSVYVRRGELVTETDAGGNKTERLSFRTGNVITGSGAVSRYGFAALGSEPLFLTQRGVCALTASDLTGERYQQGRSFFIDPALHAEANPEEAVAAVYGDFYVLAYPSGHIYLLDGLQKTYVKDQPYSSYQYECFCWTGIYARCVWTNGDALCFGDEDGHIYHFYTDPDDPASYSDNGEPIAAYWQTPELDGGAFDRAKTFRRFSVQLRAAAGTSATVRCRKSGGAWHPATDGALRAGCFRFSTLCFSRLCFSGGAPVHTLTRRLAVRCADTLALRLENDAVNEPFGLEALALEYTQAGRFRR